MRFLRPDSNLGSQAPIDKVALLYPQAHDYLFVTFYHSQGYDGDILTRLRKERNLQ
jgi:hypothetical protein